MADSSPQSTPIQEGLRLMSNCPLCKRTHSPENAKILSKKDGAHLVHITCPHCSNAMLALVVVSGMGLSSVGMVTDLHQDDVVRLGSAGQISEDELLAFHELIKNNKINFK